MVAEVVSLQRVGVAILFCGIFCVLGGLEVSASEGCCNHRADNSVIQPGSAPTSLVTAQTSSASNFDSLIPQNNAGGGQKKRVMLGTRRPVNQSLDSVSVRIQRPAVIEAAAFSLSQSPTEQFNTWLRLNVHPSLCQFVLCQRACALTEMPCRPLGVSAMRQYLFDRNNDGCCDAYEGDKSKAPSTVP